MIHRTPRSAFWLIGAGLVLLTLGACHHFWQGSGHFCPSSARRQAFERHVAEVCVKAAESVKR